MPKKAPRKTATKKRSNRAWFIRVRGSYLPNSRQGWLTYIPFVAYLIAVMVIIGNETTSWLMKFLMITVQFIAAAVVMTWVAATHSK